MTEDPFGTAQIRERVLAGWAASVSRFREDANAEEDLALGGYRDRLLVELAQNAADAAGRAGLPGDVLLALVERANGPVLVAANTGDPLDAAGVQALATLRASAKREADLGPGPSAPPSAPPDTPPSAPPSGPVTTVGRFGVGFSAVLAVCDEPAILSTTGSVGFSASRTADAVARASVPALAAEVARRDGHVPVLRLPFPVPGSPPAGYATAVELPLRDAAAHALVVRLLADLDDTILLALPGLRRIVVQGPPAVGPRALADVDERWNTVRRNGFLAPELLADRPTEERRRTAWSVVWAAPRAADQPVPAVVHAPTPTDEPLAFPALLIASLPLDPTRRHVALGPATTAVVAQAAAAYTDLVTELAERGEPVWPWIPAGLATGALDAALRAAAIPLLAQARILAPAELGAPLLRAREAVALDPPAGQDPQVVAAFRDTLGGLILAPRAARGALEVLGVQRMALADLVEQLPLGREPAQWRGLYDALEPLAADPLAREAFAAVPVPLADGRVVRGPRGLVLPLDGVPASALAELGVRVVHRDAAHHVLERLGAQAVTPRSALDLPQVAAVVAESLDRVEDGDGAHVAAVLTLVAAALGDGGGALAADLPWLAELALTDDAGDVAPAGELVLPGSAAAAVLDPADVAVIDPALLDEWGADTLRAVGVLDGLGVLRAPDVSLGDDAPDTVADLPGWQAWVAWALRRVAAEGDVVEALCHEVAAVRDLDAVRPAAWPQVLDLLAGDPATRQALVRPARITVRSLTSTHVADVLPWTAWWLRQELFDDRPWPAPDADRSLVALLGALTRDEPAWVGPARAAAAALDTQVQAALGAVRSVTDLDGDALGDLLTGLADPAVHLDLTALLAVWAGIAELAVRGADDLSDVDAPERVRVVGGDGIRVVDAAQAVVVDGPQWLQLPQARAAVVVPGWEAAAAVADVLDLARADELDLVVLDDDARRAAVPAAVAALLPQAPLTWCEHESVLLTARGDLHEVAWWVEGSGPSAQVHASTVDGLARGLAWAGGRWSRRHPVAELLSAADEADQAELLTGLLIDEAFGA